ncbi:DegT/DnrJ/EryC1/StrS family aminotransferase [Halogranum rubrum]|uniref:Glutamine--scyllo-inositol transaminase n=1 Tax=Halogranum salarium B-1 TaxID=1210908 RepID=J3ET46_9EURY|nr:DegT/DnrJ/EryC1/StrS aminotransferase family protein [Halogranum salarium]EJN57212.1 Glutamine--scyllo-inositol transaminase [Halogranum salarium B-1]
MSIPIADPEVGDAELKGVVDVLESGQLAAGEAVSEFEARFADYCGAEHAVATTNGTTALHTALTAVGVEQGDTVVTTPFSFVATANTIRFAGAEPVFADVDPETFNLDPHAVEQVVRDRDGDVDGIMPVHLYGLSAEMDHLREIAEEYDVPLVEDAAQAHGAGYHDETAGSMGDAACFSFYPTKNMTTGEGGMITTNDEEVANAARRFVNHGRSQSGYEHVEVGHNFRMTNLCAAIGVAQMDRIRGFNEARRENAAFLTEGLADTDAVTPTEPEGLRHVYHQYTIRVGNREELIEQLDDHGVGSGIYYPNPIHELEAYEDYTGPTDLDVAETVAQQALSLPVHPNLTQADLETIVDVMHEVDVEPVDPVATTEVPNV